MRAAYYDETGPARSVFRIGDLPKPNPAAGEVLVRVHASGVNPTDTKVRGAAPGREKPFDRIVPHHDGAGVVEAVGEGVAADLVGRRVWIFCAQAGRPFGTAAEYVALPVGLTARLPDDTPFDIGAAIGVPCLTAWNAVLGDGPVAGKTVLVAGGAGAVGNYAVQVARLSGSHVIATVSSADKARDAEAAGAHATVDYRDTDAAKRILDLTGGKGVDHFVDVDTTTNAALAGKVMAMFGRIASYGSRANSAELPVRDFRQRCVSVRFLTIHRFSSSVLGPMAEGINAMLEIGALKHRIAARLPLDDIATAHELVEGGSTQGKVIVEIG